ncbi:TonB-dependent receptor [Colwellia sp. 75C3]|uniref:TonB-dependent receptor domain-containing protein n=1 Tax=Colwellia sp. 75C3 TaxID=888425 RepID=UPI000C329F3B|nr:TonB-dependent receptor [Colwellia sp. 75C3]PKG83017.1 TonB-dependent receptor [Colwellia sp. 75C3]
MNTNQKTFRRTALSVCIAALLSPAVMAAEDAKTAEAEKEVERIIVTGSNIYRGGSANFSSSAPVTEIGKEVIEGVGSISVESVLNSIPSVTSDISASSNNNSFSAGPAANIGTATTSLRNLGSARTLVLVNGRRYVSGVSANTGYGVDLNSIPTATIERIDVLTGGQSAIYGSDAIAGVINIITKKDFEGFEVSALAAESTEGGAGRSNVDFTYGTNFDTGNVWVSSSFAEQKQLDSKDRAFAAQELRFLDTNGDGDMDAPAVRNGPNHVDGSTLFAGSLQLFGNGDLYNNYDKPQPLLDSNFKPVGPTDFDNQNAGRLIVSPYERFNVSSGMNFDLSDKSSAEIEINYSRTSSSSKIEEGSLGVRGDLFRGGDTGIDVATSPFFVGSSAGEQLLAELNTLGNGTSLNQLTTGRRIFEIGDRVVNNNRSTFRVAGSYSYEFEDDLLLKTSAVYGITSQQQTSSGDYSRTQLRNAVTIQEDPLNPGQYQCADEAARAEGCVPINPFGTVDSLAGDAGIVGFSPEGVDYVEITTGQTGEIKQTVVSSVLSGFLPYSFNDDEISFAAGVEYRKEEAIETPDSFRQLGLARSAAITAIEGEFDVAEIFGELYVPVADWLNVSLAARVADYSTVGVLTTYRLGLDAPINDSFRLRASQSSSVRAPNINDLFSNGVAGTAANNVDACNGVSNTATDNISVNCSSIASIAARQAANGGVFQLEASEANNTTQRTTGNVNIKEETADSLTLGVVFTPIDSLSLSLDYYAIEIENGITSIAGDVAVQRCHNVAPGSFDATCEGNVKRDASGPILQLNSAIINANTITTSGVDLEVSYSIDDLHISFLANFLGEYDEDTLSGTQEFKGRILFPEFRSTTNISYNVTDELNLFSQIRYRSETESYLEADRAGFSEDLNTMDAVVYVDLKASYQVMDSLNVYIGANNLFDQEPDIDVRTASVGTNTEPRAYDAIGRTIFAGLKLKF